VNEYARNGVNALLVPPKKPSEITDAVARLIRDQKLRQRLVKNGYNTVKAYCHKREAQETAELFQKIATVL
jgi:glycosyltransferase involved in cell wall biosynthesis